MQTYCIIARSKKTEEGLLSCRETKARAKARLREYEHYFGKYNVIWEGMIYHVI